MYIFLFFYKYASTASLLSLSFCLSLNYYIRRKFNVDVKDTSISLKYCDKYG